MAEHTVRAPITGSVWAHSVGVGQRVLEGTTLLVCESMKTEVPITAPVDGVVTWLADCGISIDVEDRIAILDDASML